MPIRPGLEKDHIQQTKSVIVIAYVGGILARAHRVLKKYGIATAFCPHTTLRRLRVHAKDITVMPSILKTETAKHMTGRRQDGRRQHEQ